MQAGRGGGRWKVAGNGLDLLLHAFDRLSLPMASIYVIAAAAQHLSRWVNHSSSHCLHPIYPNFHQNWLPLELWSTNGWLATTVPCSRSAPRRKNSSKSDKMNKILVPIKPKLLWWVYHRPSENCPDKTMNNNRKKNREKARNITTRLYGAGDNLDNNANSWNVCIWFTSLSESTKQPTNRRTDHTQVNSGARIPLDEQQMKHTFCLDAPIDLHNK